MGKILAGWFKLHRELKKKPIWTSSTKEQKVILITLLMMADYQENEWEYKGKSYKTKPGQFVTSLPKIAKESGDDISIQNVRTALARFIKYDFLTDESTKQNRLITIVNWASYQGLDDVEEKEKTVSQQTSQQSPNRHLTANKELKNLRTKELKDLKDIRPKSTTSDVDFEMANLLYDWRLKVYPKTKKPKIENWANEFRLLRELDGGLQKDFKYIIEWSQNDSFWKGNIRSAKSFRNQYETLYIRAEEEYKKKTESKADPKKLEKQRLRERLENEEN